MIHTRALLGVLCLELMQFRGAYWLSRNLLLSAVRRTTSLSHCSSKRYYLLSIVLSVVVIGYH